MVCDAGDIARMGFSMPLNFTVAMSEWMKDARLPPH